MSSGTSYHRRATDHNLVIRNVKRYDQTDGSLHHVFVQHGLIDAIIPAHITPNQASELTVLEAQYKNAESLDGRGAFIAPGFIDLSARLREPGNEHKATLESELEAAAAGGVTTVVCPPDTDPTLDEPGLVEMLKRRAASLGLANVLPCGAFTVGLGGSQISELGELTEAGCVAFSQATKPIVNTKTLFNALQYASSMNVPVWLMAMDAHLSEGGVAHSGEVAARLGLSGISVAAETIALATLITLAERTSCRLHIERVSSAAAVQMLAQAKARGLAITADVAVHHLHLTDRDIGYFDSQYRTHPPLREPSDRTALQQAVRDGVIDAICSDHTPVDDDMKLVPFAEADAGNTGLELLLPLTLQWGRDLQLSLAQTISKITTDAARVLGITSPTLSKGARADLVVFDSEREWIVTRDRLKSQGKNSPYLNRPVRGQVDATVVAGRVVFRR
jgi:dihydroorotase